jgi:hypothetical protein
MKTKFKETTKFRTVTLEIMFETLEEMVSFADILLIDDDHSENIFKLGNEILGYIKKYNE